MKFQKICVLGMGYIGLPTASTFAKHGLRVVGVDINQRVLERLRNGQVHIQEPGLRALVETALGSGNLSIAAEPQEADAYIIAVPTPALGDGQGRRSDLSHVTAACESILPVLKPGNLVMLESTCPPGTTANMVAPILERSGLTAGSDFLLAYTPERVLPGRILQELVENARVIGGIDRASAEAGQELYGVFVRGQILLTDATTAEMVKLMENTYRDANIALANEFARLAQDLGVDVWEAIRLANLHPRVEILRPGPGVGGHCISIDPWFLVEAAPELAQLIRMGRTVNDQQPAFALELIHRAMGALKDRRIAGLGLAYKAEVDDLRESPAMQVAQGLVEAGASLTTLEPYALTSTVDGAQAAESLEAALEQAEAVVLLVDHAQFRTLAPEQVAQLMPGRTAIDLRGAWDRESWRQAGFALHVLGVGEPRA